MSAKETAVTRPENGAARRVSPFNLLQQEIDRVFEDFGGWRFGRADLPAFSPSMEVAETEKTIEITTELPGIEEKDVEISVSDGVLSIRGEKKAEREEKNKSYRLVERSYGSFQRSLALPPGIDTDSIKANMSKGVLKITLPKPTTSQAQKIQIAKE